MSYAKLSDYTEKEFPSKYLKGGDLKGKQAKVKVARVVDESVFNPQVNKNKQRLVMYFVGKDKGVILGKERTDELIKMFGDIKPELLAGKEVTLESRYERGKDSVHFVVSNQQEEAIELNDIPFEK